VESKSWRKNSLFLPNDPGDREGGEKKGCELQPTLKPSLDAIVEPTAKGDPMSPLRWTTHSTRRLANKLRESGLRVSKTQVGQLLHERESQSPLEILLAGVCERKRLDDSYESFSAGYEQVEQDTKRCFGKMELSFCKV